MPMDGTEIIPIMTGRLEEGTGALCFIEPLGNELYISLNAYREEETDDNYLIGAFYRWNSKTRRGEYLYGQEGFGDDCKTYFGIQYPLPIAGDGLYYTYGEEQGDNRIPKIMKVSFQTGTLEEFGVFPEKINPDFTKDYIISCDNTRVSIYDYNLNLINQSDPVENALLMNFIGGDSQYAFFLYQANGRTRTDFAAVPIHGGDMLILRG